MKTKFLLIIIIIFISTAANAQQFKDVFPKSHELLANPITLRCGVTIKEWQNKPADTRAAIAKLNNICDAAVKNFAGFAKAKGLTINGSDKFHYSLALLADNRGNRHLGDNRDRFRDAAPIDRIGFTVDNLRSPNNDGYMFMVSNHRYKDFSKVLFHELFHAMGYFYDIYRYADVTGAARDNVDERYAQQFTRLHLQTISRIQYK